MNTREIYYFSICHGCKKPEPDLKKCSNCRVVYYCCRQHQLRDWPKHKDTCKAITKTSKFREVFHNSSPRDFNSYKYTLSLLWKYELGRELTLVEQQMWMFPKVCAVCYSKEAEIVCQECLSVAYCSEEHQNSHAEGHKKHCPSLKLCLVICTTLAKNERLSVEWLYFSINKEIKFLPESVELVIRGMGYANPSDYSKEHVDYVIMTEYFSLGINILHGLYKSGFVEGRQAKRTKLTVHLVGPSYAEDKISWILILEFLTHWIHNLTVIKIFLIGPEVPKEETATVTLKCEECKAKNFVGVLVKVKGLYHDRLPSLPKPDLVVAFNSGLHEFADTINDTWKKSIPKLIRYKGVPTILTAYTEVELKKDLARFNDLHVNYIVKPQRNPYSSLRPNRNWEEGGEPIFYHNGYVAIITRK